MEDLCSLDKIRCPHCEQALPGEVLTSLRQMSKEFLASANKLKSGWSVFVVAEIAPEPWNLRKIIYKPPIS